MKQPIAKTFLEALGFFCAILLVAGFFWSGEAGAESADERCAAIEELAASVMENRQLGVSLADSMRSVESPVIRKIILDAYDKPRYQTEVMQRRQIEDFAAKWALACYQAVR